MTTTSNQGQQTTTQRIFRVRKDRNNPYVMVNRRLHVRQHERG